jgi:hypothetical protein
MVDCAFCLGFNLAGGGSGMAGGALCLGCMLAGCESMGKPVFVARATHGDILGVPCRKSCSLALLALRWLNVASFGFVLFQWLQFQLTARPPCMLPICGTASGAMERTLSSCACSASECDNSSRSAEWYLLQNNSSLPARLPVDSAWDMQLLVGCSTACPAGVSGSNTSNAGFTVIC